MTTQNLVSAIASIVTLRVEPAMNCWFANGKRVQNIYTFSSVPEAADQAPTLIGTQILSTKVGNFQFPIDGMVLNGEIKSTKEFANDIKMHQSVKSETRGAVDLYLCAELVPVSDLHEVQVYADDSRTDYASAFTLNVPVSIQNQTVENAEIIAGPISKSVETELGAAVRKVMDAISTFGGSWASVTRQQVQDLVKNKDALLAALAPTETDTAAK